MNVYKEPISDRLKIKHKKKKINLQTRNKMIQKKIWKE